MRRSFLIVLTVVAFVLGSMLGTPTAISATYGTMLITADTTLTEVHVGHIVVAADNVSLNCNGHFVVGDGHGDGILLQNRTGVDIENCFVTGFEFGFRLDESPSNTLTRNTALVNGRGFFITRSPGSELVGNTASSNSGSGFDFRQFSGNAILTDNLASSNGGGGFGVAQSSNMTLTGNTAAGSTLSTGFSFTATGSNVLERNIATNNNVGFSLWGSEYVLDQNLAAENWVGFLLSTMSNSTLAENTASENFWVFVRACSWQHACWQYDDR